VAIATGALLMATLVWLSVASCRGRDIRLELCAWYIVVSAAAIAWGRGRLFGVEYALTSRYGFLSMMLLSITWVLLALRMQKQQLRMLFIGVIVAGIYTFSSYHTYSTKLQAGINERINLYNRGKYQVFLADFTSGYVREAASMGIYKPPPRPQPMRSVDGEVMRRGAAGD